MEASVPPEVRQGGPSEAEQRGAAILLALAAVVGISLGARASLLSSDAADAWQTSVREEIKRAAGSVEDVRFVYSAEGPEVFAIDVARLRAEQFRRQAAQATGETKAALLLEADTFSQTVNQTSAKVLPLGPRYRTPEGGFDAARRLADQRRRYPDLVAIDPEVPQRKGDDLSRRAMWEVLATIPAALAFLFGALAEAFRPRRFLLSAGVVSLAVAVAVGIIFELVAFS